jgi:sugar lactone lactonase YvrE
MADRTPQVLLEDVGFGECPRWHDGLLWFSAMDDHVVFTLDERGTLREVLRTEASPGGLGFLPDGRLLLVTMQDRRLWRRDQDGLQLVADLSEWEPVSCNDMVVDAQGRASIGGFGFDLFKREAPKTTALHLVDPAGQVTRVADDLAFPNGMAITPDNRTLIVAESMGRRLTAFAIQSDGTLTDRRVFAALAPAVPDGICLDEEGAVWVSSPTTNEFVRVADGGEVLERVETPGRQAIACMLGGGDRRTLYLCTAGQAMPEQPGRRSGRLESVRVDVPGAGLP